jgi:hypothetical protein
MFFLSISQKLDRSFRLPYNVIDIDPLNAQLPEASSEEGE